MPNETKYTLSNSIHTEGVGFQAKPVPLVFRLLQASVPVGTPLIRTNWLFANLPWCEQDITKP